MSAQHEAIELFARAFRRGRIASYWSALRGRPNRLEDLRETFAAGVSVGRRFDRLRSVPLAAIRGSENRGGDFDARFRPLNKLSRSRWQGIAEAMLRGMELPPAELIQVGDRYYVRDGHHRISVAAALGRREIDALITRWQVEERPASTTSPTGAAASRQGLSCATS
jgi:hypothetical protein